LQKVVNYEQESSNDSFGNSKGPSQYHVIIQMRHSFVIESNRLFVAYSTKTNNCKLSNNIRIHRWRV